MSSNDRALDVASSDRRTVHAIDDITGTGLLVSDFTSLHQLDEHTVIAQSIHSRVDLDEEDEVVIRTPSPTRVLSLWQSYGTKSRQRSSRGSSQTPSSSSSPIKDKSPDTPRVESLASISLQVVPSELLHSKLLTDFGTDSTQNVDKCYRKPGCSTSSSEMQPKTEEAPANSRNDKILIAATGVLAISNKTQDTNVQSAVLQGRPPVSYTHLTLPTKRIV